MSILSRIPHPWYTFRGYAEYNRKIEAGDVASHAEQVRRAKICASCLSAKKFRALEVLGLGITPAVVTCGHGGVPNMEAVLPTCGCPLMRQAVDELATLTMDGIPLRPYGLTEVGTSKCPQCLVIGSVRLRIAPPGETSGQPNPLAMFVTIVLLTFQSRARLAFHPRPTPILWIARIILTCI